MPDLDDLFEDVVDAVKKQVRRRRKQRKQRRATGNAPAGGSQTGKQAPAPWARLQQRDPVIHNRALRTHLQQAQAYEAGMKELVRSARTQFNRTRMDELTRQIRHWQTALVALVQRVDAYQQNHLLQTDLATVPEAIARLERQLADGPPPRLADELARTLASRQRQLDALESLQKTMRWAEVKIENTVSMLGAIYSQALMSQSTGQVADYRRLLDDVTNEARSLDDYVTMLAEVKLGK